MAVSKAKWTQAGFSTGFGPLEMYGSDDSYDQYDCSNLQNHPYLASETVPSSYTLDLATGHLGSNFGGGLIAVVYNVNIHSTTKGYINWTTAADMARVSTFWTPLVCLKSTSSGQLSCSATSRADSTKTMSNLVGYQQGNIGYSFLGLWGSAVPSTYDSNDAADATLTLN